VFGTAMKDEVSGAALNDAYEIGNEGFDICSIQFAIHYMFENPSKLHNFLRNVSENTRKGGYFIGTSYDGSKIFKMLKDKEEGMSETIVDELTGERIWHVTKRYNSDEFRADRSSLGYAIDVYQETINKVFTEYLVNYDYLTNVLRNYGFEPEQNAIKKSSFKDLYTDYKKSIKKDNRKSEMNVGEQKISFLNRLFVFRKVRNISDIEKITENMISGYSEEEEAEEGEMEEDGVEKITKSTQMTRKNRTSESVNTTRKN
jgi:hypothetical protein